MPPTLKEAHSLAMKLQVVVAGAGAGAGAGAAAFRISQVLATPFAGSEPKKELVH